MAALSTDEDRRRRRRQRLVKGLLVGAAAVGIPTLLRRLRRRPLPPGSPDTVPALESHPWHNGTVAYRRSGEGSPTLILVHSLGPGHHGIEWEAAAELFARRREVVVLDLPGWGHSVPAAGPVDPDAYADLLRSFVTDVVRGPAVLVAVQRSAPFAILAARALGGDLSALGLVAPRGLGDPSPPAGPLLRRLVRWPIVGETAAGLFTGRRAIENHLRTEVYRDPKRVDADVVTRYHAAARQKGAHVALAAHLAGDLDRSVGEAVGELDLPVWLAWGRRSTAPPVEAADLWLSRLPDVEIEVFEGAGLLPHAEVPTAFRDRMEEFLARLPG